MFRHVDGIAPFNVGDVVQWFGKVTKADYNGVVTEVLPDRLVVTRTMVSGAPASTYSAGSVHLRFGLYPNIKRV